MTNVKHRNTVNRNREREEEQRRKNEESLKEEQEINQEIKMNSLLLKGCYIMLVILVILPELKPIVFPNPLDNGERDFIVNLSPKIVPIVCVIALIFSIWIYRKELTKKAKVLAENNARISGNA